VTEDGRDPKDTSPSPRRSWLRTWWGRILAGVAATGVVISTATGVLELGTRASAWLHSDTSHEEAINQSLSLDETPVPGEVSNVLGFGDAIGGRPVIAYNDKSPVPADPVFNAFVDIPYWGSGDERMFMAVGKGKRPVLPVVTPPSGFAPVSEVSWTRRLGGPRRVPVPKGASR
jgi:hypothetical protein